MKRALVLLAIVALAFTSCKKDNLNLEEKIIGKWIRADVDGQPALTNEKMVITFVSTTKGYLSAALNFRPEAPTLWANQKEVAVAIDGNMVTVTNHQDEHTTAVEEYTVTAINDNEFTANHKVTMTVDGTVVMTDERTMRYTKLTADYTTAILGKWECQELTGIETYNDANARLEFFADGTYRYWRKNDGGEWEAVTNREFQNYFVVQSSSVCRSSTDRYQYTS